MEITLKDLKAAKLEKGATYALFMNKETNDHLEAFFEEVRQEIGCSFVIFPLDVEIKNMRTGAEAMEECVK